MIASCVNLIILRTFSEYFLYEDFQAWNFIKTRLEHRCFPVNVAKSLRTPILTNIYKWLPLRRKRNAFQERLFLKS